MQRVVSFRSLELSANLCESYVSMCKFIKLVGAASASDEVLQIEVHGKPNAVYILQAG
ncbi:hypothetical protein [Pseudomonas putida]|uniref:hypothetical protein n=1 Tax=Pseudomonas putida TaxID=303 RepID=UPI0015E16685|nr:hypothetical protein [Pseudomonas putida]